ncbi:hypothetical protein [Petrimonas sp.]|uniref:hypothetical protein n=1 Tax=Petrimonas sp. TaxID=2023866 RepID=UPI003F50F2C2
MKEKEFKLNRCESEFASPAAQQKYSAPDIEVTDIEIENMFAASFDPIDEGGWT